MNRICDALRGGNTRRVAAIIGGISEATFYNWISYSDPSHAYHDDKYVQFLEAITRAEAEAEAEHVKNLQRQGIGDWRASVEWLKRRKPKDWSEKVQIEQRNYNINLSELSDEELDEFESNPAGFIAGQSRRREGEAAQE